MVSRGYYGYFVYEVAQFHVVFVGEGTTIFAEVVRGKLTTNQKNVFIKDGMTVIADNALRKLLEVTNDRAQQAEERECFLRAG